MDHFKELREVFKKWPKAKKEKAELESLALGFARVFRKIEPDDMTPHPGGTEVVFGGDPFMVANIAGALGVYSYLGSTDVPLLLKINNGEFMESIVAEEKYIVATARVALGEAGKDGKVRKYNAFIDITNPAGDVKAEFELFYYIDDLDNRKGKVEKLRQLAREALERAH